MDINDLPDGEINAPDAPKSPLDMTDAEIRTAYSSASVRQRRELERNLSDVEYTRVEELLRPRHREIRARIAAEINEHVIPAANLSRMVGAGSAIESLSKSLLSQRHAIAALEERATPSQFEIPERPEIGLLQRLVEHQKYATQAAVEGTQGQIREQVEARRQAGRTHRFTRAATVAGVLAGPLALYVAAVDKVPTEWAITFSCVWVVAPTVAFFWGRKDPVLDTVEQAQLAVERISSDREV